MKVLYRILGAAAAVAATGAAIVVLDKLLNRKDPLCVEAVEFPEEAEQDAAEAEAAAEAYEAGEAAAEAAADTAEAAAAAGEAAAETAEAAAAAGQAAAAEAPIVNPVEAGPAVAPTDANGNFDPARIADPKDFADWEEQGCQG